MSVWVAEFWNSLSSLAMVVVGAAGVALHWGSLEDIEDDDDDDDDAME